MQALAIKDGRILAVGSDQTIKALAGPGTEQIDLLGATATPGLLDAHAHFARGGVYLLYELDLSDPAIDSMAGGWFKITGGPPPRVETLISPPNSE